MNSSLVQKGTETQIYGLSLRFMITAVQWTKESSFRLRKTELDGSGPSVKQEHQMSWFHTKCTFFLIFKKDFLLFYVCKCFKCICVCAPTRVFDAFGDQRRVLNPLELEF